MFVDMVCWRVIVIHVDDHIIHLGSSSLNAGGRDFAYLLSRPTDTRA